MATLFIGCFALTTMAQLPPTPKPAEPAPVQQNTERVTRAALGVFLGGLPDGQGALIGKVAEQSPAAKAGLHANDIILQFDGVTIQSALHVYQLLLETPAQRVVTLQILRQGQTLSVPVQLGEQENALGDPCERIFAEANAMEKAAKRALQLAAEARQRGDLAAAKEQARLAEDFTQQAQFRRKATMEEIANGMAGGLLRIAEAAGGCGLQTSVVRPTIGLTITPLSQQLARYFGVEEAGSWLVTEVKPQSWAAQNELQAGDCLVSVNGQPIASAAEFQRQITAAMIEANPVPVAATTAASATATATAESTAVSAPLRRKPAPIELVLVREQKRQTITLQFP